ncbi:8-oxoguanine DNA glycosylase [Candidatus Nanobsidianus stetteri]|uniref:8-oxoguanine DNA glycosylase n=1 Tax=Nanobsidianus stetteri TaxID=1294122 RepID=R1E4H4_NANST|nr:8-oxoguanine DNA glycosylase [Candidatus Nanobsidianus stetteri]
MDLIDILSKFSIEEILYFEENYDLQYRYLRFLYKNIKNQNLFLKLIVINSLLAFQLSYKGEKFWKIFSIYFSKHNDNIYNNFLSFIDLYNRRFKEIKIKRLNKIYNWIKDKDLLIYKDDLVKFNSEIAKVMGQNIYDKTIVFSTKIYGYGLRIIGYKIIYPFEIFIPIDNRIGKISKDKNYWIKLSKEINIPLLHIDSLIWITMGLNKDKIERIKNEELKNKIKLLKNYLDNIINN